MKSKIVFLLTNCLFLGLLLFFTDCKKNKDEAETCSDGIQNQGETGVDCGGPCTACTSVLCDGNGTTSFFPLKLNNSWTYSYKIGPQVQSISPSPSVTGTTTHGSYTYFEFEDQSSTMYGGIYELREDATSHNIHSYSSSTDYLYIPASPTLNQSWAVDYGNTRKVTNLSASATTAGCTYTGLLEISQYDSGMVLQQKEYYKKGIGLVYRYHPPSLGFDSQYSLTSLVLN